MTSTRPRLVILSGSVPLDQGQIETLKSAFNVVEVPDEEAARKVLDDSVGGIVICAPGEYLHIGGKPTPTAEPNILHRIGEGIGVVDSNGTLLWTDARFKVHDKDTREAFTKHCLEAIELFNQPEDDSSATPYRQSRRFSFSTSEGYFEHIVSPAVTDQTKSRVTTVVGVLWDVTTSYRLQERLDEIDAAGAELIRIDADSIRGSNMGRRLKVLEEKIIHAVRDVLHFENFEVRLLDRETGRLELVIAHNFSPLKVGEVLYAKPDGNGLSGYVATTGESYMCHDVRTDPLYREGLENAASALTIPLLLYDRVVGTFNAESTQPNAFDENDRRFAEIFGRYIATAMNILDLLVVERYSTCKEMMTNITGELTRDLNELKRKLTDLSEDTRDNESISSRVHDSIQDIEKLRQSIERCASGPATILGAEEELHRQRPDPLLKGKRVLIVDDEKAIRETMTALLRQKGCEVTICSCGVESLAALKTAQDEGTHYDLVISDIKLPDRNGYEIYRTAKSIDEKVPVILMTGFGYDPNHCIVRASQEGLQSFLFKPFQAGQLLEALNRALAEKKA